MPANKLLLKNLGSLYEFGHLLGDPIRRESKFPGSANPRLQRFHQRPQVLGH